MTGNSGDRMQRAGARALVPHSRPWITDCERAAVEGLMRSGSLATGAWDGEFRAALTGRWGGAEAYLTPSGTTALVIALRALRIGPGDGVILPTYVCEDVLRAVRAVGATPQLCDCGPHWVVTPSQAASVQDHSSAAIIVPMVFGIYCDLEAFRSLQLPVIGDFAQCFDATLLEKGCGDIATCSFQATKCLTTGVGGALFSRTHDIAAAIEAETAAAFGNFTMSDISAALGMCQLGRYQEFEAQRAHIGAAYLSGIGREYTEKIRAVHSMYYRFLLSVPVGRVPSLFAAAARKGIAIRRGVDTLLHRAQALEDTQFPNAVALFNSTISIPAHPSLTA